MTGSVVNLNRARKARDRTAGKVKADENAVKHGRTKAERLLEASQEAKAQSHLDQHMFEDDQ